MRRCQALGKLFGHTFFLLSRVPWSALAAVGRGASGEKNMSLVRKNDQLYKAKVKRNGLRTGTRRSSQSWGWLPYEHAKGAKEEASRCGAVPPYRQELSSAGSQNWRRGKPSYCTTVGKEGHHVSRPHPATLAEDLNHWAIAARRATPSMRQAAPRRHRGGTEAAPRGKLFGHTS